MGAGEAVDGQEGVTKLARTQLGWRMVGRESDLPVVVFENGWSASYQQWTLLEPLLAPHTRMLCYDRAGIGASAPGRSEDGASLSQDLSDLLTALNLHAPVVVVGQSYGGLIAGLHAAQIPSRVCGAILLDPTPELDDELIDKQLGFFNKVGRASVVLAQLRVRNPLFAPVWEHFPERQARLMESRSYHSPDSLRAALHEMEILPSIRRAIAAGLKDGRNAPRLVISAGATSDAKGWLMRRLLPERRLRQVLERMQSLHRAQAARGNRGSWEVAAAHTHGGLVSTPAGAAFSAGRILAFLQSIRSKT